MSDALALGGNKITGLGAGTAVTDAVTKAQVFAGVSAKGANDYTLLTTDIGQVLTFDGSAAIRTVSLLAKATAGDGYEITVKKVGGGNYPIILDADGTETIDGALTFHIRDDDESVTIRCDGSAGTGWQIVSQTGASADKSGTIKEFAGATIPAGYLACDGAEYAEAIYVSLFAAIANVWDTGGETSNFFRVPDKTGRMAIGKESSETRVTTAETGVDGGALGAAGGVQAHALSEAELAQHDHTAGTLGGTAASNGAHTHPNSKISGAGGVVNGSAPNAGYGAANVSAGAHTHTLSITGSVDNAGSNATHTNLPPCIVCNFMIKI
jgi:microcystin-dependent protein